MRKNTVISCLYPNKCAGCGEIIDEDKMFCNYCSAFINNIDFKNFCTKCGMEKENCRCKYREFHFEGNIGLYKNEGIARKAYYSYKLGKRNYLASFFAENAVKAVKSAFVNVPFDAVCAVPTAFRSRLKHGFDHNRTIALKIAEIMNTEYIGSVLKARHFRRLQHKSTFDERLENVRGKYYTVSRISKKCVLLFDDIYTTGATLDECAKELLFAGVRKVYCVSVLMTDKRKKKEVTKNGD